MSKHHNRVGVFSGTFDPVHKGHITFALEAIRRAGLTDVYFLPEQTPPRKHGVTHYAHRLAMLRLALQPYPNLHILELPDRRFTVAQTLPRLEARLGAGFSLLLGSDAFRYVAEGAWPGSEVLLQKAQLIVAPRIGQDPVELLELAAKLPDYARTTIIDADNSHASSSDIRSALVRGKEHDAHLKSLQDYIKQNWLYCSVAPNNS